MQASQSSQRNRRSPSGSILSPPIEDSASPAPLVTLDSASPPSTSTSPDVQIVEQQHQPPPPDVLQVYNELHRINRYTSDCSNDDDDDIDVIRPSDNIAVNNDDDVIEECDHVGDLLQVANGKGSIPRNVSLASHLLETSNRRCNKYTPHMEDMLRRKLKFHFMDPVTKFRARRDVPWKLIIQLVKIILVTVQLIMFGTSRFSHITFVENNTIAFKHLFLRSWDPSREPQVYPPSTGKYAIYQLADFYLHVEYAVRQYTDIKETAIGSYDFTNVTGPEPVKLCKHHYKKGDIWPANSTYDYDSHEVITCLNITVNETGEHFNVTNYLHARNFTINFDKIIKITLEFALKAIHLKTLEPQDTPDCYQFNVMILYDNSGHNGQIPITLDVEEHKLQCHGNIMYE